MPDTDTRQQFFDRIRDWLLLKTPAEIRLLAMNGALGQFLAAGFHYSAAAPPTPEFLAELGFGVATELIAGRIAAVWERVAGAEARRDAAADALNVAFKEATSEIARAVADVLTVDSLFADEALGALRNIQDRLGLLTLIQAQLDGLSSDYYKLRELVYSEMTAAVRTLQSEHQDLQAGQRGLQAGQQEMVELLRDVVRQITQPPAVETAGAGHDIKLEVDGDVSGNIAAGVNVLQVVVQQVTGRSLFPRPPAPVPDFTGRQGALAKIVSMLKTDGRVGLVAVQGLGGLGKTATALEIANKYPDLFPDGILWAELGETADAMGRLGVWATALGGDVSQLEELEARQEAVRNMIAGRRLLAGIRRLASDRRRGACPPRRAAGRHAAPGHHPR